MSTYIEVLKKYAVFSGRAPRKEYWMFVLINMIVSLLITLPAVGILMATQIDLTFLANIYSLAVLCPGIAVGVRRLHDTNRSGWWMLLALIPFIGAIVLLVFLATAGTSGSNQFGEDPYRG